MSKKAKNKDTQILNAAAKHFAINGFGGARVDEIAAEAGVNKATLYYRIGDKAAIYDRIFIDMLDNVLADISEKIALAKTAEDKFKAYAYAIANVCSSNSYISPFILREVASGGSHMSENAIAKMKQVRLTLAEILTLGVESGEFKPVNPFLIHIMMIGTLNFFSASYSIREKASHQTKETPAADEMSILDVAETISDLILSSIKIKESLNKP